MMEAPAREASRILDRARERLVGLSRPAQKGGGGQWELGSRIVTYLSVVNGEIVI